MRQRALILDRDGVINVDSGYVGTRSRFVFQLGVFPFLRAVQERGYRLAIVTNQSGVGRGYYTEKDYNDLTEWMLEAFRLEGVAIDLVLACFCHKESIAPEFKRESFWRKPNPGMILEAAQRLNLDLRRSAMIGDKDVDMLAAQAAGVGKCLLFVKDDIAPTLEGVVNVNGFDRALKALT